METLDLRESRSSLAGLFMAAAVEAIGVFELVDAAQAAELPHDAAPVVHHALTRPGLSALTGHHAALASHQTLGGAQAPSHPANQTLGGGAGGAAAAAADTPLAEGLLTNSHLQLSEAARASIESGTVDPRALQLMAKLASEHDIVVKHCGGATFDVSEVDGERVGAAGMHGRELAASLAELPPGLRPRHVSTPWALREPGFVQRSDARLIRLDFKGNAVVPPGHAAAVQPLQEVQSDQGAVDAKLQAALERPAGKDVHAPAHAGLGQRTLQVQALPDKGPAAAHRTLSYQPVQQQTPDPTDVTAPLGGPDTYPGDGASQEQIAAWMARAAQQAGLPPELPIMASLVESHLTNLPGGDADSAGFFQMRVSVWDNGAYAGYRQNPDLQLKWFIDHAVAIRQKRIAEGLPDPATDPNGYGTWAADVEQPYEAYRGRYAEHLAEAQALVKGIGDDPNAVVDVAGAGGGRLGDGEPGRGLRRALPRHAVPVGRRDPVDGLRLLRADAVDLQPLRRPHPARRRRPVPRRAAHRQPDGPAAGRPRLLRGLDRLHPPRGHVHRRRKVPPRAAHRRRGEDLVAVGSVLRLPVRRRVTLHRADVLGQWVADAHFRSGRRGPRAPRPASGCGRSASSPRRVARS